MRLASLVTDWLNSPNLSNYICILGITSTHFIFCFMQINQYMACTDISTCAIVRFCRRAHIFYGIHCAPKTRVHRQEQVGMTPNMMR